MTLCVVASDQTPEEQPEYDARGQQPRPLKGEMIRHHLQEVSMHEKTDI